MEGPCSLVPFQNCPMFPCFHTFSECFRTVIFRILFPCSQKLANVPLFPSIFCQCSLVPQNPWETLIVASRFPTVFAIKNDVIMTSQLRCSIFLIAAFNSAQNLYLFKRTNQLIGSSTKNRHEDNIKYDSKYHRKQRLVNNKVDILRSCLERLQKCIHE